MRAFAKLASCSVVLAGSLLLPCAGICQTVTTGAFRDLSAIDSGLGRGTTKDEVRRRFGIPNGTGASQFAVLGAEERQIWYYEDLEVSGMQSSPAGMEMKMRQQILVVMFKGDAVDGYMWTSNAGRLDARK